MTDTDVSATSPKPAPVPAVKGFLPALEGMRGIAAVSVLVTHVAFQTASIDIPVLGPIMGRFDLAVALFFALSGFLLWRPYAAAARDEGALPSTLRYFVSRAARILPVYWTVVVLVLWLLPGAGGGASVWWANLTLTQVFVPLTLTDGLTQMWSLSVEVAFYLLLPFVGAAMSGVRGASARFRIPVLLAVSIASLAWAWLPVPTQDFINHTNWLPGYIPWFAAGMILAELAAGPVTWLHRLGGRRWVMPVIAAASFAVAVTPLAGPAGLGELEAWEYNVKIVSGAAMSFALLAPLTLAPSTRHRVLGSPFSLAIGRWSYGIFVWHLAVMAMVFPVFGIAPFSGHFVFVLVLTLVLSVLVSSAGYALVEEPARRVFQRWDRRRRSGGRTASPSATMPTSAAN